MNGNKNLRIDGSLDNETKFINPFSFLFFRDNYHVHHDILARSLKFNTEVIFLSCRFCRHFSSCSLLYFINITKYEIILSERTNKKKDKEWGKILNKYDLLFKSFNFKFNFMSRRDVSCLVFGLISFFLRRFTMKLNFV